MKRPEIGDVIYCIRQVLPSNRATSSIQVCFSAEPSDNLNKLFLFFRSVPAALHILS
jgi:hypothetical protein